MAKLLPRYSKLNTRYLGQSKQPVNLTFQTENQTHDRNLEKFACFSLVKFVTILIYLLTGLSPIMVI